MRECRQKRRHTARKPFLAVLVSAYTPLLHFCRILFFMDILKDRIKIERLPVFLCGPAYRGEDSDRRIILKNELIKVYVDTGKAEILPLIVDNYLSRSNAMDFSLYNVQMMEEICAAISFQTHIFLDSMSTATELGIFVNSAFDNNVYVYLPKQKDVFNIFNSGDFVREIVLKNPSGNVKCIEYHPRVNTLAISSLFNHDTYEFNDDILPDVINEELINCSNMPIELDYDIKYKETAGFASSFNEINYTYNDFTLDVAISIKLLFYICISLIGLYYPSITSEPDANVDDLYKRVKNLLKNSILYNSNIKAKEFKRTNIKTVLKYDTKIIIKHIVAFLYFYKKGEGESRSSKYFLTKKNYVLYDVPTIGRNPFEAFGINRKQLEKIQFLLNETEPILEYSLCTNSKERSITKYNGNEGIVLRQYHETINCNIRNIYIRSFDSYAYHKNESALNCVKKHLKSKGFIKFDIKDFFGSIDMDLLADSMIRELQIRQNSKSLLIEILDTVFINGKLPLGLVLSPILSDIYMHDIDVAMGAFCANQYVYTRYADDIMISSTDYFSDEQITSIKEYLRKILKKKKLFINDKKTKSVNFDYDEAFIKYVGISIVNRGDKNILTVGKKYIYSLGNEYIEYLKELSSYYNLREQGFDNPYKKKELFYTRLSLIGKINYLLLVEGDYGKKRLEGRLKKYCSIESLYLERII